MIAQSEQKLILQSAFGGVTYVPRANLYFAAIKDDGTEVVSPSYQRIPVKNTFLSGTNPEGTFTWIVDSATQQGYISNNIYLSFAESTTEWGNIKSIWIYDSLTGGNLLYKSEDLTTVVAVEKNNLLVLEPNTLKITLS